MSPTNMPSPNKEPEYMSQNANQDIGPENLDSQMPPYNKSSIYAHNNKDNYEKNEYNKGEVRSAYPGDARLEYMKNPSHKRHTSMLHGHFNHANKGHNMSEQSPHREMGREGLYSVGAPDLPPRVDRAAKPMGLLTTTTPNKTPNG